MDETYEVPRPAVMAAALALAEEDGMSVTQSYLRSAEKAIEAARCTIIEGCQFFKGHENECSPALDDRLANRDELAHILDALLSVYGKEGDSLTILANDALSRYS